MAAPQYHVTWKEVANHSFRHNWIFRHTCMHKQPTLIKHWNYIFVQIWYSYSRYSGGSFLDGLLLLLTVTLSELHKKPRTKDWVTEKNKLKNLCGGYHFFHCTPSFLRHFLSLSLSSPFPFPMVGILCDNTMSKRSEIVTLFQFILAC